MTPAEKSKLFSIKKSLKDGERPTVKTVWWIIDLLHSIEDDRDKKDALLRMQIRDTDEAHMKLMELKETIIKKLNEVFE